MRLITLVLFILVLCSQSLAQSEFVIEGQVINQETDEPIAYANVGIPGEYIGMATSKEGVFKLKLPSGTKLDTLQISAIGFETKRVEVSEFSRISDHIISLQPKTYQLNTIRVTDKKDFETAWIGQKKFGFFGRLFGVGGGAYGRAIPKENKTIGAVYAFRVKWDKSLPIRILQTRMYLRGNINDEPTRLRCRIMSIDSETGLPGKDLMHHNIIGASNKRGWLSCVFTEKDIYLDKQRFYVVFEWLHDFSKKRDKRIPPLFLTKPDFESYVLVKDHVFDKWKKDPHNLIYSVKVEY